MTMKAEKDGFRKTVMVVCSKCGESLEPKFYENPDHPEGRKDWVMYECSCGFTKVESEKFHAYKDYQQKAFEREMVQAVVGAVSGFVNGSNKNKLFAELMGQEHRALQLNFTKLCMAWMEYLSTTTSYDGRNEASVELAKKIMAIEDRYLPLV